MQKIVESNSNLQISLTSTGLFNDILVFDASQNVAVTALTADNFSKKLTDLGYSTTSRAYTAISDIFEQNKSAPVRIAGDDTSLEGKSIAGSLGELWADKTVRNWNMYFQVQTSQSSVTDAKAFIEAHRITWLQKVDTDTVANLKSFRESLNSNTAITVSGNDTADSDLVNEDAKVIGFMSTAFPNSGSSLSNIALSGLVENKFSQADEDTLLGTQLGELDSEGNGGLNLPVSAHGKIVNQHGVSTNGKPLGVIHFSHWLDSTLEFEVGRLIITRETAHNAIPVGPDGEDIILSFIDEKVLSQAVFAGAILSKQGSATGFTFVDASTNTEVEAEVAVKWNGLIAEIQYTLGITVYAKKVRITNTLIAGQTGTQTGGVTNV